MSTFVTSKLFAQPGRGDDVAGLLIEILGESLQHGAAKPFGSCAIKTTPWRTRRGFTATFEELLTGPFVIHYYDIAYYGEGIAAAERTHP